VLAAANMVAAFALATLYPPMLPLATLISMADANILFAGHEYVLQHVSVWAWGHLLLPLLLRPSWMVPVSLGIIFAGAATSVSSRKSVPRSHRRRS